MIKYIRQDGGSCCFVIAAANCLLHHGMLVPDLEVAYDIAKCRNGGAVCAQAVIDYLEAPLRATDDHELVLENGGIINIIHPIFNGHSLFVFPVEDGLKLVNSWLGPNVITSAADEIGKLIPEHHNLGSYWVDISDDGM